MGSTAIDSGIFRDIFSTEPMRRVWSDENRIQKYLEYRKGAPPSAKSPGGSRGDPA